MKIERIGYTMGVAATSLVLLWIGILKFTPAEAAAIKPYIEHSFIMSWMYAIGSVQQVSNFVGLFEIVTAILLIASFLNARIGLIAGYLALIIFITTLSFLLSTPKIWSIPQGVPVTDFFVLKDLAFLAIGVQVIGTSIQQIRGRELR
jgi:uncharacterized membrane protein YkgB